MGTNFYLDEGEGDNIMDNYPHIGRRTSGSFIFYVSREHQLRQLIELSQSHPNEELILDEQGDRYRVVDFLQHIIDMPYTEQNFVFC